jgi:hypothetical protein
MAHKYHATAHEAFEARAAEVEAALDRLATAVGAKREREARDPGLLNQALAFIGVKED